jgi:hypothetical protein
MKFEKKIKNKIREKIMALNIEKELKIYWICFIIVMLIGGVLYLVFTSHFIVGGTHIAQGIVMIRLYKDIDNWEKIENWVLFNILMNILIVIVQIIWIITYIEPIGNVLLSIIINIFLAVLGIHIWIQKRK